MSNESFGSGAWERPTRPARPTIDPPSKPPGATLGKTWQDVRKELYTPEEIAESDRRVAFEIWFNNLGDYRRGVLTRWRTMNEFYTPEKIAESGKADEFYRWFNKLPDPMCLSCIARVGTKCPAIVGAILDIDSCRSYLFQSFLLTHRSDDND